MLAAAEARVPGLQHEGGSWHEGKPECYNHSSGVKHDAVMLSDEKKPTSSSISCPIPSVLSSPQNW